MSPTELAYRTGFVMRHAIRKHRINVLQARSEAGSVLRGFRRPLRESVISESRLSILSRGSREAFLSLFPERLPQIVARAEKLCGHRVSLFDLEDWDLGGLINWHKDYKLSVVAPLEYGKTMDFRNPALAGNVDYVWELNRHQHLVTLAKAYYLTGEERFAKECVEQISSWTESNPYLMGINWNSCLGVGIRLISWLWVAYFIRGSRYQDETFWARYLTSVWQQADFIQDNYAAHSSANNHLIGEATGVFLVSLCFPQFAEAGKWKQASFQIISEEICRQTFSDGVNQEQTTAYQTFSMALFLLAALTGKRAGVEFSAECWERFKAACEFLAASMDCSGHVPNLGDSTDGRAVLLDETEEFPPVKSLLAIGGDHFKSNPFMTRAGGFPETAFWLLGKEAERRFRGLEEKPAECSRAFPEGGYYILRRGTTPEDEMVLVFDCGPLGYLSVAAHGHADALSFTLSACGKRFFIDPGTYIYFVEQEWRNYFRGTAAHNTLRIDGQDQALIGGNFFWIDHYDTKVEKWESNSEWDYVQGTHTGYLRLPDPVLCRRAIHLDKMKGIVEIRDSVEARRTHLVEQFFHLAPECAVCNQAGPIWRVRNGRCVLQVEFDRTAKVELLFGSTDPILGWESPGYGRKHPSPTLRATASMRGSRRLITRIMLETE
jgi:hypothetical protein